MAKKQEGTKSTDGKIKLQPLGDRVVVEREESESVTAGGIVLPDSAKDKPARGKIIASATAGCWKTDRAALCKSRSAIACCSVPMPATRSSSAIANCCSCAKKTSWPSSNNKEF